MCFHRNDRKDLSDFVFVSNHCFIVPYVNPDDYVHRNCLGYVPIEIQCSLLKFHRFFSNVSIFLHRPHQKPNHLNAENLSAPNLNAASMFFIWEWPYHYYCDLKRFWVLQFQSLWSNAENGLRRSWYELGIQHCKLWLSMAGSRSLFRCRLFCSFYYIVFWSNRCIHWCAAVLQQWMRPKGFCVPVENKYWCN